MTRAVYFTCNRIIRKGDPIHHSAETIRRKLLHLPFSVSVELAEAPNGTVTAEIKSDELFDPMLIKNSLFAETGARRYRYS